MWQDYVITFVQIVFVVALVPLLPRHAPKPLVSTSILTGLGLLIMGVTLGTLSLRMSCGLTLVASGLWFVIAWRTPRLALPRF